MFGLLAAAVFVRMASAPGVPVLNYHQVEDKDGNPLTLWTDQFEAQMAYLAAEGYTTITIDEMMDAYEDGTPLPENLPELTDMGSDCGDERVRADPLRKPHDDACKSGGAHIHR